MVLCIIKHAYIWGVGRGRVNCQLAGLLKNALRLCFYGVTVRRKGAGLLWIPLSKTKTEPQSGRGLPDRLYKCPRNFLSRSGHNHLHVYGSYFCVVVVLFASQIFSSFVKLRQNNKMAGIQAWINVRTYKNFQNDVTRWLQTYRKPCQDLLTENYIYIAFYLIPAIISKVAWDK